ncbi:MAG: hypothetical protein JWL83_2125, partial [Actinomycetia bacterium]|nr:hypothetical protein [Actinomycetes bacterium]
MVASVCALLSVGAAMQGHASAATGSPGQITKVVVFLQENHTFDNVLGNLCATTTRAEPCDGALSGQGKGVGTIPLAPATDIPPTIPHLPSSQRTAIDNGAMDGFNQLPGCKSDKRFACYVSYREAQIPSLWSLAKQFTVADRFFSECTSASAVAHMDFGDGGAGSSLGRHTCSAGFAGDNPTSF